MLAKFVRRLLTLLAGVGYTFLGVGLGGLFFAPGVNTIIAIVMMAVGTVFVVLAFVFETVLDAMEEKGG